MTTTAGPDASFGPLKQIDAGLLSVGYAEAAAYAERFTGKYPHRLVAGGVGHNPPQEAPQAFAEAVVEADGY